MKRVLLIIVTLCAVAFISGALVGAFKRSLDSAADAMKIK